MTECVSENENPPSRSGGVKKFNILKVHTKTTKTQMENMKTHTRPMIFPTAPRWWVLVFRHTLRHLTSLLALLSINQQINHTTTNQLINYTNNNQPTNQSTNQPINQSINESNIKSTKRLTNQPINTNQPANQTTNQIN